ncbi:transcriptional regulator, crp family (plasmid) [Legionella adelaidensis]|uniref:Transcriptional regulator, crp family n=1 Tax=Legionella adelaidensis TaxID=45056 RepID=A0A0W0R2R1_9GAMM|nr:Crp/Fnr family transcriptional regulator [Legionella adelaidensis]KTC65305.1 transcriptional regulator, crp family [Legionella adelaidensis]VEH86045.1 transcriptional regulator, crp family [Legionella adelaidensis]
MMFNLDSSPPIASCTACALENFCQKESAFFNYSALNTCQKYYKPGDKIVKDGDTLGNIFIIQEGSAKAVHLLSSGKEQIVCFYLPGEPIGFNAITTKKHPYTVITITPTVVCQIPYQRLLEQIYVSPELQSVLLNVVESASHYAFNHTYSSLVPVGERVSIFFIDLVNRLQKVYASFPLPLPMQKQEIANFLGITAETISRWISLFQKENLLRLLNKEILFIDKEKLQNVKITSLPFDK